MKMKIKEIRLTENQEKIIRLVAAGLLLATAVIAPNVIGATAKIIEQIDDLRELSAKARYHLKKRMERMVDDKIFQLAGDEIKLTKKGKQILKLIHLDDIELVKSERWNGIWHLVSYDIPEKYKKSRDSFRQRIAILGFKQIQDSLWVYPFECREEMAIITKTLGISKYVAYLTTDHLPQQDKLVHRFGLTI